MRATVACRSGGSIETMIFGQEIRVERTGDDAYRVTTMGPEFATDPRTLVALGVNGEPLDLDHGYPARIIAPARPGVLQTKWLARVEVLS